jgi:hypothetical protein
MHRSKPRLDLITSSARASTALLLSIVCMEPCERRFPTDARPMQVREVKDKAERDRLWSLAVAAYPPYAEYQARTARQIPVFVAEP